MKTNTNPQGNTQSKYNNPAILTLAVDCIRINRTTYQFTYATTDENGNPVKTTATATENKNGRVHLPVRQLDCPISSVDITDKVKYLAIPSAVTLTVRGKRREEALNRGLTTTVSTAEDIDNNLPALAVVLEKVNNSTASPYEARKGSTLAVNIAMATAEAVGLEDIYEKIEKAQATLEALKTKEDLTAEDFGSLDTENASLFAEALTNNEATRQKVLADLSKYGREKAEAEKAVEPFRTLAVRLIEYATEKEAEAHDKMLASIDKARALAQSFLNK